MRALFDQHEWRLARAIAFAAGASILACSCASNVTAAAGAEADRGVSTEGIAAMERLQGQWEIQSYRSVHLIPEEATPLMAQLFEELELRFEGSRAVVKIGASSEETKLSVWIDQGKQMRLDVSGGMFDGATLRFLDQDRIELYDVGKPWPGVSVLRRKR